MSQNRLFEFESPDSTFDINSRFLTIAPEGLYAGFDVVLPSTMILAVNHNITGKQFVTQDLSLSLRQGVVMTKQGVEVRISNSLSLPISPTTASTRRDAIILSHSHQTITGGISATISVLQNVGVSPNLGNDQVLIGIIQLPVNCTQLNQAGVIYERAKIPTFANNPDIANLQAQINLKIPVSEKGTVNGVATLDAGGKVPLLQLPEDFNRTTVVANITLRDALIVWEGRKVHVIDATADVSVSSGSAGYIWNGSAWIKIYEGESLDLDLSNYYTKPQTDTLLNLKVDKAQPAFTNYTNIDSNYDFVTGFPSNISIRKSQFGQITIQSFAVRRNNNTVFGFPLTIFTLPIALVPQKPITKPVIQLTSNGYVTAILVIDASIRLLTPTLNNNVIYFDETSYY